MSGHGRRHQQAPGPSARVAGASGRTPPGPDEEKDREAVAGIKRGDLAGLEAIMRRHNQRLFRVARSILGRGDLAEDAVQEAYIAAYYKLDSYAPTGSFAAWLTRIAINEALMIKRKQARHRPGQEPDESEAAPAPGGGSLFSQDPARAADRRDLARLIEEAVDRLPDDFRTVFVLRAVEQLSVRETAEALELKPATVKTRFHRARNLMQRSLMQALDASTVRAFGFDGERCDRIVATVLERVAGRGHRDDDHPSVH